MKGGILYVVCNQWIRDPETGKTPYTIGITKGPGYRKHYGIDLKVPGTFEAAFAFQFDDYTKCTKIKQVIHGLVDVLQKNGEWFNLDENKRALIEIVCESLCGIPITIEMKNRTTDATKTKPETVNENDKPKTMTGESINIKGIEIALYKNKDEKTQEFVKRTLRLMFDNNLLPEAEIQKMLDKDYSKKTFGLLFAILQNDETKIRDNTEKKRVRYWTTERFGNDTYYVCSQWWKEDDNIYSSKLSEWIKKIAGLNKTQQANTEGVLR